MDKEALEALKEDTQRILDKPTSFEEKSRELKAFFEELFLATENDSSGQLNEPNRKESVDA